ncbi:MAG: hypothetical protein M0Z52_07210 [Actinomycetota bacterium]|nr:hypothetical protein [Actinomycetota bacterium]
MKKILAVSIFCILFAAQSSFAAVGETYNQMAQRYGAPGQVSIKLVAGAKDAARYTAAGAKGYSFNINNLKIYALFNASNVCFKMLALHNRMLPETSVLVGPAANTAPKVLLRIPRRAIVLQYGSGANAIIYRSFGLPGNLSAEATNKSLEP